MNRVLVLVNPISGRGRGKASADSIRSGLEAKGLSPTMIFLPGPKAIWESIRDHSAETDAVIAVGGDGTLNAVVDAVYRFSPGLPVGLIPFGLANCMADELGLTADTDRAAAVIAAGKTRVMDVAMVRDRLALAFWGAGFDARVTARTARSRTGPVRYRSYAKAGWQAFMSGETDELQVEVDGAAVHGSFAQVLLIQVRNFAHYFRFPSAQGFHLLLFRSGGRLGLIRALTRCLFLGNLAKACDIAIPVSESFRVWPVRGEGFYQFDGEDGGELPAEGRILKNAVRYLIP